MAAVSAFNCHITGIIVFIVNLKKKTRGSGEPLSLT
jgi:hypothetical protein